MVRTREKRVLFYSKIKTATLSVLPWTLVANFISKGTIFCTYIPAIGLVVSGGNTECTDTGCLGTVYQYGSKCTGIAEPTQGAELSLSVSLSLSHMHAHACTCTHTQTRTRTHTHTLCTHVPPPPPLPFPPRTYLFPSFYLHVTSSSYLPSVSVYRSCQYALGSATRNPLNLA